MYRINRSQHLKSLISTNKDVFTTSDLAVLWEISNKNTLWKTVSRYVKKGVLHKIQKGLYSKVALDKLNPFVIGCAVCGPHSYISTETILQKEGAILQFGDTITIASLKRKSFNINGQNYICRTFKPNIILNRNGINEYEGYSEATAERALADLNYISPKYYLDNPQAVNADKVADIKKEVSYYDRAK